MSFEPLKQRPDAAPHYRSELQLGPLESFQQQIVALSAKRGGYLAAPAGEVSDQALQAIDREIVQLVSQHATALRSEALLQQSLLTESLQAQDRSLAEAAGIARGDLAMRLRTLELRVFEIGELIGRARGRSWDSDTIPGLHRELEALIAGRQDLLTEFPDLRQALERVRRDGERLGERCYVVADRDAMALHGAMRWYQTDVAVAHRVLGTQDPMLRSAALAAFEERYGLTFVEWADRAFFSWRARCFAMLHLGTLARIFSERWGVEVGIIDAMRDERDRNRHVDAGLLGALRDIVNEPHAQRTRALANNNRVEFARCSLLVEVNRGSRGYISLLELLCSLSVAERREATQRLTSRQCSFLAPGAGSIEDVMRARFSQAQTEAFLALTQGRDTEAAALLIPLLGAMPRHTLPLMLLFERLIHSPACGDQLGSVMSGALTSSGMQSLAPSVQHWVKALVQGDEHRAAAARIRCACLGITSEWPGEVFYRFSPTGDQEVLRRYEQEYGSSFWSDVLRRLRRPDEVKILRAFVSRGTLTLAELVRHCLDGYGADFQGVRECLRGKDARTQEALAREYSAKFFEYVPSPGRVFRGLRWAGAALLRHQGSLGERVIHAGKVLRQSVRASRDLDRDLAKEFGGHQLFDLRLLRKGQPMTALGGYDRLQERLAHERVGWIEWLFQRIDSNGRRWRADRTMCDEIALRVRNGQATEDERKRLGVMVDLVYNGCDAFREAKLRLANVVVNVASIVGALYATSLIGAAPLLSVMSGATLGALALRTVARRIIQGLGYSRRDLQVDLVLSLIEGGTLLWGRTLMLFRLGSPYIDAGIRQLLGFVTKSFARHQVTSRWGQLHQAKTSRHVILLGELEAQRARTGRSDHAQDDPKRTSASHAQRLRELWEVGLSGGTAK